MKNKKIEKQLANEVKNITPNVFDNILANITVQKQQKQSFFFKLNAIVKNNFVKVTAYAMALMLVVLGAFTFLINIVEQPYAVVALDVNPSIELNINDKNKVVSVITNNEDANAIIADMNLEQVDLNVALYALIGSMISKGYIDEAKNSILLSVKSENTQTEDALKQQLNQSINSILSTTAINGSVITQSLQTNNLVNSIMQALNISRAKASIISKIIELDARMTAESLAQLSINDLNLLMNAKHFNLSDVSVTGNASTALYITAQDAINAAILHAEIDIADIISTSVEFGEDDGIMVYEIDIETLNYEYEYLINATSGSIIEFEVDEDEGDSQVPQGAITQNQALQIALNHAGYIQANVQSFEVEFEFDDPLYIYEVSFEVESAEYEYEINALTGSIICYSVD